MAHNYNRKQINQSINQSIRLSKQNVSFGINLGKGSNLGEELIIETAKIVEELKAKADKISDPAAKAAQEARNSRIFQDLNHVLTGR